jgi:F-type H+-transporting ATPase subunit epsilon
MAIPSHLTLELVTPDHAIAHEMVDEVELPGQEGYFGILPGHTPMLATLGAGPMWYRRGQERFHLFVGFGFVEVLPERVIVLAQVAERADDIDLARAEAAKSRAEARLSRPAPDVDVERARIAMIKALHRMQVAAQRSRTRS